MKAIFTLCVVLAWIFALDFRDSNLTFKNLDSPESIAENIESYAISEKFDGVRGIWDGKEMFSKHGKKLAIPPCFAEKLAVLELKDGDFVEGELWVDYGKFAEVSSLARRKNPTCAEFESVKYLIFNAQLNESSDFLANLSQISLLLQSHKRTTKPSLQGVENAEASVRSADPHLQIHETAKIQVIPQHKFHSKKELQDFFDAVVAKGGEGVILRGLGDLQTAFKLKPQQDAECKIIDYTRGKGRLSGKVGAIVCESLADKNAGIKNGIIFRIGSGLSDEMRTNPPKIGTIITYKFSGVSKNGVPLHTRFWRVYRE